MSSVRVEKNGAVTTVILDRPHARNAVDGPTAMALFEAFTEFDADESASVAVLWGEHGTFCAGADLKAIGTPNTNPVHRPVPWEEIHRVAFELAERLRGRGPGPGGTWTGIVAITRGRVASSTGVNRRKSAGTNSIDAPLSRRNRSAGPKNPLRSRTPGRVNTS